MLLCNISLKKLFLSIISLPINRKTFNQIFFKYISQHYSCTLANVTIVLIANVVPPNCTVWGSQTVQFRIHKLYSLAIVNL